LQAKSLKFGTKLTIQKNFYYFHKSNGNSIQLVFNPEHFYGLMSNNLVPITIMGKQGWFKYFLCDFRE